MSEEKLSLPINSAEAVQSFLARFLGLIIAAIGIGIIVYGLTFNTSEANLGFNSIALSFAFILAGISVIILASSFFWKV